MGFPSAWIVITYDIRGRFFGPMARSRSSQPFWTPMWNVECSAALASASITNRSLRSAQAPWRFDFLPFKELQQLATGSALLLSNINIKVSIILHGGAAIREHPEIPECSDYMLALGALCFNVILYLYGAAPGHQRLHIQQWSNGLCCAPWACLIQQRPCWTWSWWTPSRRLCQVEYPEGLCRALIVWHCSPPWRKDVAPKVIPFATHPSSESGISLG